MRWYWKRFLHFIDKIVISYRYRTRPAWVRHITWFPLSDQGAAYSNPLPGRRIIQKAFVFSVINHASAPRLRRSYLYFMPYGTHKRNSRFSCGHLSYNALSEKKILFKATPAKRGGRRFTVSPKQQLLRNRVQNPNSLMTPTSVPTFPNDNVFFWITKDHSAQSPRSA